MTSEKLLLAIGEVGEDLIDDAAILPKRRWGWSRALAVAAVLVLVLTGAFRIALRLDYFSSGCSAWPGTIVGDTYYYSVFHSGLWRWTEDRGKERVFSKLWTDGWLVTEDAFFYSRGLTLYREDIETGQKRKLYQFFPSDATHFGYEQLPDGSLILTVYNKHQEYKFELRIDAMTGALLETLTDHIPYSDRSSMLWTEEHPQVGNRDLRLVVVMGDEYRQGYDLYENGVSILPEGTFVSKYSRKIGSYTAYELIPRSDEDSPTSEQRDLFILRPDGEDVVLSTPNASFQDAVGDWLYYVRQQDGNNEVFYTVHAYNMMTGEDRELIPSEPWEFYGLETDGTVMYTCVPWGSAHTRWRVEYDAGGDPTGLTLLDADIARKS